MKVFNFYNIEGGRPVKGSNRYFVDHNDEYYEFIKNNSSKKIGLTITHDIHASYYSDKNSELKDVSHLLYKITDFIPERDGWYPFNKNGTATLFHRKIDDFCRIQHLEYDEIWDVKNCSYMDYRQFLSECRDLELTIPKHLIR